MTQTLNCEKEAFSFDDNLSYEFRHWFSNRSATLHFRCVHKMATLERTMKQEPRTI
jgi:hypothetical protein